MRRSITTSIWVWYYIYIYIYTVLFTWKFIPLFLYLYWFFCILYCQSSDGSYTGFIRVHFQLVRPVSLVSFQRPTPLSPQADSHTSFYLPRETTKQLHVSSRTRVREVVEALLNKFMVIDNPAKFALFECSKRNGQGRERRTSISHCYLPTCVVYVTLCTSLCMVVLVRKLQDHDRPLLLRLCAGPHEDSLSFMLRENETGDINVSPDSAPTCQNSQKYGVRGYPWYPIIGVIRVQVRIQSHKSGGFSQLNCSFWGP